LRASPRMVFWTEWVELLHSTAAGERF
jgi:hypothetical protein